ncbi:MAG: 2Fe-2S iron-sulfur cluster binding domain-containing protein, partial [Candidatus Omnitrophica bacterium]|nr:2Fe-2S iron-sulfur cluster binding domain-containing protein [Candidatus Omnitrophota bacterium]
MWFETFSGTVIFTGAILALVAVIQASRAALVNTGDVNITVNGDDENPIKVPAGSTLLSALASKHVYLPSACGGGGTCAMCKCQVLEGGGDILPTETSLISRGEQKEHWRLSCQVKIRQDLKIHVPDEIFKIQKWECTVRSNQNVATFIKELILELPKGENLNFTAGGYIQIYIPPYNLTYSEFEVEKEYHEDWDTFKLWDLKASNDEEIFRAYSMANHP